MEFHPPTRCSTGGLPGTRTVRHKIAYAREQELSTVKLIFTPHECLLCVREHVHRWLQNGASEIVVNLSDWMSSLFVMNVMIWERFLRLWLRTCSVNMLLRSVYAGNMECYIHDEINCCIAITWFDFLHFVWWILMSSTKTRINYYQEVFPG